MRKLKVEREKLPPQKIQFDDEREVVIQYDRLSDYATIWSADRTETAKFKKVGAEVIEQTKFGTKFKVEKAKISIDGGAVQRTPESEKLKKITFLYFNKFWKGILFANHKMNWGAYNSVKTRFRAAFTEHDLYLAYSYMLITPEQSMSINQILFFATKWAKQQKEDYERRKTKELSVQAYEDNYLELLCQ